jgi:hypothetical protein
MKFLIVYYQVIFVTNHLLIYTAYLIFVASKFETHCQRRISGIRHWEYQMSLFVGHSHVSSPTVDMALLSDLKLPHYTPRRRLGEEV